jgi:outer membrane biogenesis lipoprotein LolB
VKHSIVAILAAVFLIGCSKAATAPTNNAAPFTAITISLDPSSGCATFTPSPASAQVDESVEWTNDSGSQITLYQFEGFNNGVAPLPITTIQPGETSSGVEWTQNEIVTYYGVNGTCANPAFQTLNITAGSA